ncbi:MAG: GNAT family N-acetyltransferase [Sphingobacteriales bacterium]|nr:GNAT family N-acetyltransferase [Sphingobacteriales bacterium]MBI3718096.1 GNAT family N-acetyltransferase [Sphingobacteriales bacterium]
MELTLRNGIPINTRLLQNTDVQNLFNYVFSLSVETKSRFGPHLFNRETIEQICNNKDDVMRYVAIDESTANIVGYMLFKQGMIYWDDKRYAERNQYFNYSTTVTYAPSVADAFQSSGLGSVMYNEIEKELRTKGIKHIVLWGGVQATNERAVNFYKKFGYELYGSFWHDEKDNLDMVKELM